MNRKLAELRDIFGATGRIFRASINSTKYKNAVKELKERMGDKKLQTTVEYKVITRHAFNRFKELAKQRAQDFGKKTSQYYTKEDFERGTRQILLKDEYPLNLEINKAMSEFYDRYGECVTLDNDLVLEQRDLTLLQNSLIKFQFCVSVSRDIVDCVVEGINVALYGADVFEPIDVHGKRVRVPRMKRAHVEREKKHWLEGAVRRML